MLSKVEDKLVAILEKTLYDVRIGILVMQFEQELLGVLMNISCQRNHFETGLNVKSKHLPMIVDHSIFEALLQKY